MKVKASQPQPGDTLSSYLYRVMEENPHITQKAMAALAGVSVHAFINYLHGNRDPILVSAYKIARALGVSTDCLAELVLNHPHRVAARRTGEKVASYRERKGVDINILAQKSGIPKKKLLSIEAGECEVDWCEIQKLAAALEVKIDQLRDEASSGREVVVTSSGIDPDAYDAETVAEFDRVAKVELAGGTVIT